MYDVSKNCGNEKVLFNSIQHKRERRKKKRKLNKLVRLIWKQNEQKNDLFFFNWYQWFFCLIYFSVAIGIHLHTKIKSAVYHDNKNDTNKTNMEYNQPDQPSSSIWHLAVLSILILFLYSSTLHSMCVHIYVRECFAVSVAFWIWYAYVAFYLSTLPHSFTFTLLFHIVLVNTTKPIHTIIGGGWGKRMTMGQTQAHQIRHNTDRVWEKFIFGI